MRKEFCKIIRYSVILIGIILFNIIFAFYRLISHYNLTNFILIVLILLFSVIRITYLLIFFKKNIVKFTMQTTYYYGARDIILRKASKIDSCQTKKQIEEFIQSTFDENIKITIPKFFLSFVPNKFNLQLPEKEFGSATKGNLIELIDDMINKKFGNTNFLKTFQMQVMIQTIIAVITFIV